jgi:predicted O-methyltransferase YrrM
MFGHSPENAAVAEAEPEVVGLLRTMIRAIQPRYVIETGCYHGTTSRAIGEALTIGHLDTMDIDSYSVDIAHRATMGLPVTVHHSSSLDFIPDRPIDFMFLDSGIGDLRARELSHFYLWTHKDTVVAMHDSRDLPWPIGWRHVNLPTPRGLLLLQQDR